MVKTLKICAIMLAFTMLGGCALQTGEELLRAPKPAKSYLALQVQLDQILKDGAKNSVAYTTPESGKNRNMVQLKDLDNDGEPEAISFFREAPPLGNKFTVYVHQKIGDEYIKMGEVSGTGLAIASVEYPRLTADGQRGVLISWRMANENMMGLTLCAFQNGKLTPVLETSYTSLEIFDMDADGVDEFVTLFISTQGKNQAQMYDFREGKVHVVGTAAMSGEMKSIVHVRRGYATGQFPAVYAEGRNESGIGLMTDIFLYDGETFRNVALENAQTAGGSTYRPISVYATDINSDGIVDIPRAVLTAGYQSDSAEPHYLLDWYSYGVNQPKRVRTTYHNTIEQWKLTLPDTWHDAVQVTKEIGKNRQSCTVFSEYRAGGESIEILRIYCLSGDAQQYFMGNDAMVTLVDSKNARYVAEIPEGATESGLALTMEQIKQQFSVIAQEWDK